MEAMNVALPCPQASFYSKDRRSQGKGCAVPSRDELKEKEDIIVALLTVGKSKEKISYRSGQARALRCHVE